MEENAFILEDRLQKIRQIISKYGEDNFTLSFSGGKDSTVLSELLDMALPGNKIPRVYCDTGIELNMIQEFVSRMKEKDERVVIIKPHVPIKAMLDEEGYPFKSKHHSAMHELYSRNPESKSALKYANREYNYHSDQCPKILQYQFTQDYHGIKMSDKCCKRLKEEPLDEFGHQNNKQYSIVGIMPSEGGRRESAKCLSFSGKTLKYFHPLVPVSKAWEDWFIDQYNIEICDIYKPPYNFHRTGCKGCPFNPHLQRELETLGKYLPNERKQCEIIWKPVYDEYRRIGYRLKRDDGGDGDADSFFGT